MAFALVAARPNSHPFQERQLSLKEPVKIGRAVAKAKSSPNNGIFDCKVLSRNHAVMWYENGKFMLQDTKSSNGTYVNNVRLSRGSEESEPCEIKSGDILQFGVEVVENSKNVTHGCVVGLVTLFHEDGTEATGSQDDGQQGLLSLLTADKNIQPHELWQLSQFLQDALYREQTLETKLATLQRMIANSHAASEETFQGFIQEDKLLSRLETLENQLELVSKDMSEEEVQGELITFQEERLQYESAAKETLQNILKEKIELLQKCNDLERLLSNSEDECTHGQSLYDKSQEELQDLMEKYNVRMDEMQELKGEITAANQQHESACEKATTEKEELKSMLDKVERRGSSLAVEVESLQAECDFTKKQLEAMKERLEQHKTVDDDSLETADIEKMPTDLPFASDHATLEKEVKNKSAYIETLKVQLAEVQTELQKEKRESEWNGKESSSQKKVNTEELLSSESSGHTTPEHFMDIHELQDLVRVTKDSLVNVVKAAGKEDQLVLECSSCNDFVGISDCNEFPSSIPDQEQHCKKAFSSCRQLLKRINGDLKTLLTVWIKEVREDDGTSENQTNSIKDELTDAYEELEEVRQQILVLGEKLVEEQETNKRTKELAASLEQQLYEAHKHMNIEQLDKSMSYASLESARRLANEMQKQASDYAKAASHEKVENDTMAEENESLKMKVSRLESECKKLKHENVLLTKTKLDSSILKLDGQTPQLKISKKREEVQVDDLQEQLLIANQSFDELMQKKQIECDKQSQKRHQLVNLVITLFILLVAFGAMVLLDIIKVTPGSLPLLDEKTWTEILESLF